MDCVPKGGYITRNLICSFIEDGRQEAVKAGIDFLIEELSKDESKRKILLIRDIPSNVELWVAAIISAFPVFVSSVIPFSTNKSIGKNKSVIFYYSDKTNQLYSPIYNKKKGFTKRHPRFMIVGFHPEDPFCHSITQDENSDYVLLDGERKYVLFKTSNRRGDIYYKEAVVQSDRFLIFRDEILPQIGQLESLSDIRDLYEIFCQEWDACTNINQRKNTVLLACKNELEHIKTDANKSNQILKLFKRTLTALKGIFIDFGC